MSVSHSGLRICVWTQLVSDWQDEKDFTSQRATGIFNIKEEWRLFQIGKIWMNINFRKTLTERPSK
jgi:hypothetical protein